MCFGLIRQFGARALVKEKAAAITVKTARQAVKPLRETPEPAPARVLSAAPELRSRERPADEWQAMQLPAPELRPVCVSQCQGPFPCVAGRCEPCIADDECVSNELCVLGHCIAQSEVECISRTDCPEDALCILSDYPPPPAPHEMQQKQLPPRPDASHDAEVASSPPGLRAGGWWSLQNELKALQARQGD
jgi:hypothetical protein